MNSSLRTVAGSGMLPLSRLAPASLKDTSLTLREKVENALSFVDTSGCGTGGGSGAFTGVAGSDAGGAGLATGLAENCMVGFVVAGFSGALPNLASARL